MLALMLLHGTINQWTENKEYIFQIIVNIRIIDLVYKFCPFGERRVLQRQKNPPGRANELYIL